MILALALTAQEFASSSGPRFRWRSFSQAMTMDGKEISSTSATTPARSVQRSVVRAMRASREITAGCVWINDHIPIVSEMPHGGFGQSGFGKDMSQYAFDEYTNVKHVSMDITGEAHKPWHRTVFTYPQ